MTLMSRFNLGELAQMSGKWLFFLLTRNVSMEGEEGLSWQNVPTHHMIMPLAMFFRKKMTIIKLPKLLTIHTLCHQLVPLIVSISHPFTAFYPSTSSLQTTNLVRNSHICRSPYVIICPVSSHKMYNPFIIYYFFTINIYIYIYIYIYIL